MRSGSAAAQVDSVLTVRSSTPYLVSVYGPGKGFAISIIPGLVCGKWKNFGPRTSQMMLIHVEDTARLVMKVAESERSRVLHQSFVFTMSKWIHCLLSSRPCSA